jgi:hypothetical protein
MPPYPPKNAPTGCARRPAAAIGVGRYQRLRRTSTAGEPVGRAVGRPRTAHAGPPGTGDNTVVFADLVGANTE